MARMQPSPAGSPSTPGNAPRPLPRDGALERGADLIRRRREQILYLAVGGWNTIFGYGIWALLQVLLGDRLHYLAIVLIAWPVAVLNAYLGYRLIVFRSTGSVVRELPRFALVYVTTLAINLVLLPIALRVLPFTIYVTQAVLTAIVVVGSYVGHRSFSFGGRSRRPSGTTTSAALAPARKD
jgi:putative flippase GtrA